MLLATYCFHQQLTSLQRGHLVLGIAGVVACGLGWVWFKGQNADKANLGNTNYKGEGKGVPAASHN